MENLFNIDFTKISTSSKKEALDRKQNFDLFLKNGLPNKKNENWKFSDLNLIISKNFKKITNNDNSKLDKKIELINDFDHNHIILINGVFKSCDIKFEEKKKLKVESLNSIENFKDRSNNNLHYLNKAFVFRWI